MSYISTYYYIPNVAFSNVLDINRLHVIKGEKELRNE